jgi:hypothetical protein
MVSSTCPEGNKIVKIVKRNCEGETHHPESYSGYAVTCQSDVQKERSTKSVQGRITANILRDEVPCVDLVEIYIEEKARVIH